MGGGVPGENAFAGTLPNAHALLLFGVPKQVERLLGGAGDQYLFADLKDGVESSPVIAHDRRATGGGFKQADTGRVTGPHHIGARDVQREALRVVETAMLRGRKVIDALDIRGPLDV